MRRERHRGIPLRTSVEENQLTHSLAKANKIFRIKKTVIVITKLDKHPLNKSFHSRKKALKSLWRINRKKEASLS